MPRLSIVSIAGVVASVTLPLHPNQMPGCFRNAACTATAKPPA